jgi:hypothetical protein
VVATRHAQAVRGDELVVQAREHRRLVVERTDVERLHAESLVEGREADVVQSRRCALRLDGAAGGIHEGGIDPFGLHDQ